MACDLTHHHGTSFLGVSQVDHIDGDRYNNNLNNLRALCANCHAQKKMSHTTLITRALNPLDIDVGKTNFFSLYLKRNC